MSLKLAFASVLKAMRATKGLSQKILAEVSSRTYISKLERAQCSPTLEMMTALSVPLGVSPLTLMTLTMSTESGLSIKSLITRLNAELSELASAGVIDDLRGVPTEAPPVKNNSPARRARYPVTSELQAEFSFTD